MFKLIKYCVLLFPIIVFVGVVATSKNEVSEPKLKTQVAKKAEKPKNLIPGLEFVDVYLNMEKRGYKTKKYFSDKFFVCTKEMKSISDNTEIDYLVECHGVDDVHYVRRVNARVVAINKNISAITLPELCYIVSLPYDGAEPRKAQQWVTENINNKAETIIGGVKFEIEGNENSRHLTIYMPE